MRSDIEERSEAVDVFNSIFAVGLFYGYSWEAIQNNDLYQSTLPPRRNRPGEPVLQGEDIRSPRKLISEISRFENRPVVDADELRDIISTADELYNESGEIDKIQFALQAFTHYKNQEHSQSFLLNWILLEQYISQILNKDLKNKLDLNHGRRDRITDSPNWFASHRIELAEIIGSLEETQYNQIDSMRKRRNSIVHEMDTATPELSENIMELTIDLLGNELPFVCENPVQ